MRILMLGWELPPHNSGGLGVACYHLSKALALQGASIDFLVPYNDTHPDIDFMEVHATSPISSSEQTGMLAYDNGQHENHNFSAMIELQKEYESYAAHLAKTKQPDAIHAHDWLTIRAGIAAKAVCDAPLIVHVHATEFDRSGELHGNPIIHEIEQQGLDMADRIIAVSNITKQTIARRYNIPLDKIEVMHNAIDVDSFGEYEYDLSTYRYIEDLKRDGYTVVGTVTRFTIQKGLTHLLRAAAKAIERYDRLVFVLAGDGEQRDELLRLSAELGISDKVIFTGFIRGKQWRDAYSLLDIFVMSSVSEPFGLTALEAAHHDSSLILSRQSGVSEVLHNVLRYDFWDVDRLADQIVGLALSPALHNTLKRDVTYEYTRISWQDVASSCVSLYHTARQKPQELTL